MRALKSYKPKQYSGSVTIFKAQPGPYLEKWDWRRLVTGELKVSEYKGNHEDLRNEPHLCHWALRLKESLDPAETNITDK